MPRRTEGPCGGKRSATLAISIVVALTTLTAAPAGQAGPLVASADGCTNAPLEQPFVRWLDVSPYVLVADGGFENGASGWSLSGAGVVDGNEPYHVHGADESKSLSISSGGSATSATTGSMATSSTEAWPDCGSRSRTPASVALAPSPDYGQALQISAAAGRSPSARGPPQYSLWAWYTE